ncbi:MAG: hypothetical protein ACFFC0_10415 [Promethearchaeota archaeon]
MLSFNETSKEKHVCATPLSGLAPERGESQDRRAIVVVGIFLLIAMMPGSLAAHTMLDPFVADLIAGGANAKSAIDVGETHVCNDRNYLYVKYVTQGEWTIIETHLHVAPSLDGIT